MYLDFYTGYGRVKISLSCCCSSSSCTSLPLYLLQESPMSTVKKVDCALLPPCSMTVWNKLRRAHYISLIWCNADGPQPGNGLDPTKYGWLERNGCYVPDWFSGPAIPDDLFKEVEQGDDMVQIESEEAVVEFDESDQQTDIGWSEDSDSDTEM